MPSLENRTGTWRFGVYEVDTRRLQLRRSGVSLKLREQSFRILLHLLEHAGEIVTREDLRRLLWPADTFVDFDHSLNTAVMKIRGVLGDPASAPMYVETIPRRGYRFIAPVVFIADELGPLPEAEPAPGPNAIDDEFSLAVLPFKCTGSAPETSPFAEGLTDEIVSGLKRFGYLRVVRKECGARYILDGAMRQAGSKLRATVRLADSVSGETLWTETYEQPFEPDSLFDLQDYLVPRVVSTIADWRGILPRSISEALRLRNLEEFMPEESVLRTCGYFEQMNAAEHCAARTSLEHSVQAEPENSLCWAMLSLVCKDEFAHGFNVQPDSLDRALAAAQRSIESGPNVHLAYLALATVLFFKKDFQAFRSAADRALELNPIDAFSIATLGSLIAYSGEWGLGCALAERAHDLNPHQSGRYWFSHLLNAYRKGDYGTAVEIASRINMPHFWQSNLVPAAAFGQLGDTENACRSLEALEACRPGFRLVAREEMARWWDSTLVDHLLDGIQKADSRPPDQQAMVATGDPQAEMPSEPHPAELIESDQPVMDETPRRSYMAIALSVLFAIFVLIAFVLVRRYS